MTIWEADKLLQEEKNLTRFIYRVCKEYKSELTTMEIIQHAGSFINTYLWENDQEYKNTQYGEERNKLLYKRVYQALYKIVNTGYMETYIVNMEYVSTFGCHKGRKAKNYTANTRIWKIIK